jgi:hypothetical protein
LADFRQPDDAHHDPQFAEPRRRRHAGKLDEVICAIDKARNRFVGIEHRTDDEIEQMRADLERECAN